MTTRIASALLLTCGLAAQELPRIPPKTTAPLLTTDENFESIGSRDARAQMLAPSADKLTAALSRGTDVAPRGAGTVLFDQPEADGALWAVGSNYKASFDATGWSFFARPDASAPGVQPIRFRLASARIGALELELRDAIPGREGRRVTLAHGAVVETLDLDDLGVQQSFVFGSLPRRGEIVVTIEVATEVPASAAGGAIAFQNAWVDVGYSAAIAIDADGRTVAAPTELVDGQIVIRVPTEFVEGARLPLVIDPRVSSRAVHTGAPDHGEPDVVWDQAANAWQVVYMQNFAAGDWDCYVQFLAPDLTLISTPRTIDATTNSWFAPRIANLRSYQKSMVVCEVRSGALPVRIVGRILDSAGNVGGQIEVANSAVNELHPDIGGDAEAPGYFTVVWEHVTTASNHDIYARQVTDQAGLFPWIAIDTSGASETAPTISKANGAPPRVEQRHTVVYQRLGAGNDIYGAFLSWNGAPILSVSGSTTFPIDTSSSDHRNPQASTPTVTDGNGHRRICVVYESPNSNAGDIIATSIDEFGAVIAGLNVNLAENNATRVAWPQSHPAVDCDGLRFGVTYHEPYQLSTDFDVMLTLLSPSGSALLVTENTATIAASGSPEFNPLLAARFASTNVFDKRMCVVVDRDSTGLRAIDAFGYEGPVGSFSTRNTGCGALTIGYSGSPTPGGSLLFSINSGNATPGFLIGQAVDVPLTGLCHGCTIGATGASVTNNLFSLVVPVTPGVLGASVSVQGYMIETTGGPCLGAIHLTDTVDVTVQ